MEGEIAATKGMLIPANLESPSANYSCLPPSSSSFSPSSSSSSSMCATTDTDLASPTYTSIRNLLLPRAPYSAGATSIRNPLVNQAARSYLQPMETSPSAGRHLLSYFSLDSIKPFLSTVKRAIVDLAARASNCLSNALWLLLCR